MICYKFFMFIFIFFISIVPWHYRGNFNRTSRVPSLMPVHETSGAGLWQDIIEAVETIQEERTVRRILTDSVTRFVLYSATRGQIWWWTENKYFPHHGQDYQSDFLTSDTSYSLLVINNRNGDLTNSARYAGHWPDDILKVSQKYPNDLDEFVSKHSNLFELLWSSEGARIYMMHPNKL